MTLITGICGSPRRGGNSELALKEILNRCKQLGAQIDLILLSEKKILTCNGCLRCEDDNTCPIDDDSSEVFNTLIRSDIIIFSTPSYFDNMTGILKNFIDRTNLITGQLKGKKAAIIIVGQADETSWIAASQTLETYCKIVGIDVIGKAYGKARKIGDISGNQEFKKQLSNLISIIKPFID
jgi:multimeric flavodoxin WrbA